MFYLLEWSDRAIELMTVLLWKRSQYNGSEILLWAKVRIISHTGSVRQAEWLPHAIIPELPLPEIPVCIAFRVTEKT